MSDGPSKRKVLFDEPRGEDGAFAAAMRGEATVGEVLAHMREARGLELADVASHLRIREPFLAAIETGDPSRLPGPTYAIGFVRSYANFLGLNGDEAARLFKGDRERDAGQAELVFPEPVAESRIPKGAILFLSVLLAVAAYGGWYYLTSRDMTLSDLVPAVPANLGGVTTAGSPPPKATATPSPAPKQAGPVAEKTKQPAPVAPERAPTPEAKAPVASEKTAAVPQKAPENAPEKAPAGATKPPPATYRAPAALPETASSVPEKAPAAPAPAAPAPAPVPAPEKTTATASVPKTPAAKPAPAKAAISTSKAAPAPAAAGSAPTQTASAPARIELRAKADSWVQIRGHGGRVVLMRILRTGDTYQVPDEKGLTLMTGNAGAIEITVNGKPVPPIGPYGTVRRDVVLDAARLEAGTAVAH